MIQPEIGRLEFASDLRMVRASLVTMTETASKAIRAATTALLDLDLEAVRITASLEQEFQTIRSDAARHGSSPCLGLSYEAFDLQNVRRIRLPALFPLEQMM